MRGLAASLFRLLFVLFSGRGWSLHEATPLATISGHALPMAHSATKLTSYAIRRTWGSEPDSSFVVRPRCTCGGWFYFAAPRGQWEGGLRERVLEAVAIAEDAETAAAFDPVSLVVLRSFELLLGEQRTVGRQVRFRREQGPRTAFRGIAPPLAAVMFGQAVLERPRGHPGVDVRRSAAAEQQVNERAGELAREASTTHRGQHPKSWSPPRRVSCSSGGSFAIWLFSPQSWGRGNNFLLQDLVPILAASRGPMLNELDLTASRGVELLLDR